MSTPLGAHILKQPHLFDKICFIGGRGVQQRLEFVYKKIYRDSRLLRWLNCDLHLYDTLFGKNYVRPDGVGEDCLHSDYVTLKKRGSTVVKFRTPPKGEGGLTECSRCIPLTLGAQRCNMLLSYRRLVGSSPALIIPGKVLLSIPKPDALLRGDIQFTIYTKYQGPVTATVSWNNPWATVTSLHPDATVGFIEVKFRD